MKREAVSGNLDRQCSNDKFFLNCDIFCQHKEEKKLTLAFCENPETQGKRLEMKCVQMEAYVQDDMGAS